MKLVDVLFPGLYISGICPCVAGVYSFTQPIRHKPKQSFTVDQEKKREDMGYTFIIYQPYETEKSRHLLVNTYISTIYKYTGGKFFFFFFLWSGHGG